VVVWLLQPVGDVRPGDVRLRFDDVRVVDTAGAIWSEGGKHVAAVERVGPTLRVEEFEFHHHLAFEAVEQHQRERFRLAAEERPTARTEHTHGPCTERQCLASGGHRSNVRGDRQGVWGRGDDPTGGGGFLRPRPGEGV
jgi:hypothetical protein